MFGRLLRRNLHAAWKSRVCVLIGVMVLFLLSNSEELSSLSYRSTSYLKDVFEMFRLNEIFCKYW
jgi:hypothetical protein